MHFRIDTAGDLRVGDRVTVFAETANVTKGIAAPREAVIRPLSATTAEVELIAPEDGVSPGQACVFYAPEGSRVLGGGWIWKGRSGGPAA